MFRLQEGGFLLQKVTLSKFEEDFEYSHILQR